MLNHLLTTSITTPQPAAQKFHRLILEGMAAGGQCVISTWSAIPVTPANHHKRFWNVASTYNNGVRYSYVPMFNFPGIKNIGIFLLTFLKVLYWGAFSQSRNRYIICDILNTTITTAALTASKINGVPIYTIVTDLPGLMVTNSTKPNLLRDFIYGKLIKPFLYRFNGYILLTPFMNEVVNKKNRPYMIMEGLVDSKMNHQQIQSRSSDPRIVLYAGGLYEKYGIKTLIDAFKKIDSLNVQLHLYGYGDMVETIDAYIGEDKRIVYKGMVPNKEAVKAQLNATLLVNPRPSGEEFTKFSFPSKILEYMVSGTPVLTTKLPGMPKEYFDYVYLIEKEDTDNISQKLYDLLSLNPDVLQTFGARAKSFVLDKKNNIAQSRSILHFLTIK